jgi:hypothetical protein
LPTPSASAEPPAGWVLGGTDAEEQIEYFASFGLRCERGAPPQGPDAPPGLEGAICLGSWADGNAEVSVHITYWSNDDSVLKVEASSFPFGPSGTSITDDFRSRWIAHVAGVPYEKAVPAETEEWLVSNRFRDCSQTPCQAVVGAASIGHVRGLHNSDQISFGSAMFGGGLSQRCTNEKYGFSVSYPGDWHTNEPAEVAPGDTVASCTLFAPFADIVVFPEVFNVPIFLKLEDGALPDEGMPLTIDMRPAVLVETEVNGVAWYVYYADVGEGRRFAGFAFDNGSASFRRSKAVLDAMIASIDL